jgi:small subunit ribosomal protein S17
MKVFIGRVVSLKMPKTATVAVERTVTHPIYLKRFKREKIYHVHDELGVSVGDSVRFVSGKPISKLKKFKILEVVGKKPARKKGK